MGILRLFKVRVIFLWGRHGLCNVLCDTSQIKQRWMERRVLLFTGQFYRLMGALFGFVMGLGEQLTRVFWGVIETVLKHSL